MQLSSLPPMGASPDATLIGVDAHGQETRMPVECKALCPFKHNTGAGEHVAEWTYVASTSGEWKVIPAHHYALCQITQVATACSSWGGHCQSIQGVSIEEQGCKGGGYRHQGQRDGTGQHARSHHRTAPVS